MTLDQLVPGDRARVIALEGDDETVERLMEMGLVEGTVLELVRFAPLGDPLEIAARGYRLTLRRVEASGIEIEKM
jgi:ferrous iron transport protein A